MQPRHAYALFMVLAVAVFLVARYFQPRPVGLAAYPWWKRLALPLAGFIGGSLGAKLPFVLINQEGWFTGTAWLADGKTITVGLMGAYIGVELAKLHLDIRVKTGDSFALPLALALAVGRWGCFFNGCCYGTETSLPWGVYFRQADGGLLYCHPTQVYEVIFHLTMAGILVLLIRQDALRFQRLKFYLIGYGIFRFATEFIRPEPIFWLGLTFYQWIALTIIVAMSIQWPIDRRWEEVPQPRTAQLPS